MHCSKLHEQLFTQSSVLLVDWIFMLWCVNVCVAAVFINSVCETEGPLPLLGTAETICSGCLVQAAPFSVIFVLFCQAVCGLLCYFFCRPFKPFIRTKKCVYVCVFVCVCECVCVCVCVCV